MSRAPRARRTQAQRTAETRQALLDAAHDAVVELGYRATTTTEVAHRAGVSLGALLHHFPTKTDLVVAAAEHAFTRRQAEYLDAMAAFAQGSGKYAGSGKLDASVDLLWTMMSGPGFAVCMELVVAARSDAVLAAAFAEVNTRFLAACEQSYARLWTGPDGTPDPAFPPVGFHLVWALMEGLAVSRLVPGHRWHPAEEVIGTIKALLHLGVEALRQAPPTLLEE
ncbi:TetR/AcrR family transcriptional regulator [Actinocorallia aurea]